MPAPQPTTFIQAIQTVFAASSYAANYPDGMWSFWIPESNLNGEDVVVGPSRPLICLEHLGEGPSGNLPGSGKTFEDAETRTIRVKFHLFCIDGAVLDQTLIPGLRAIYNPKATATDPLSIQNVNPFASRWDGTRIFADPTRSQAGYIVYVAEVDYTFQATFGEEGT